MKSAAARQLVVESLDKREGRPSEMIDESPIEFAENYNSQGGTQISLVIPSKKESPQANSGKGKGS